MLDSMIGDLARAIQDDRRAEAAKQAQISEAARVSLPAARSVRLRRYRAATAAALMALAARLAPPVRDAVPRPDLATRATP